MRYVHLSVKAPFISLVFRAQGGNYYFLYFMSHSFCSVILGKGLRPLNSVITLQLSRVKAHSKEHFLFNVVINVVSV